MTEEMTHQQYCGLSLFREKELLKQVLKSKDEIIEELVRQRYNLLSAVNMLCDQEETEEETIMEYCLTNIGEIKPINIEELREQKFTIDRLGKEIDRRKDIIKYLNSELSKPDTDAFSPYDNINLKR